MYIYIYIYMMGRQAAPRRVIHMSEGGMIQLETLVELKSLNSSCSSNLSVRVVRVYPLIEIWQAVPCRAIRANCISVNSTLPPS